MKKSKQPFINNEGLIRCDICGGFFSRVMNHARMAHKITESDYRAKFGYSKSSILISEASKLKSSNAGKDLYHSPKGELFKQKAKLTTFK